MCDLPTINPSHAFTFCTLQALRQVPIWDNTIECLKASCPSRHICPSSNSRFYATRGGPQVAAQNNTAPPTATRCPRATGYTAHRWIQKHRCLHCRYIGPTGSTGPAGPWFLMVFMPPKLEGEEPIPSRWRVVELWSSKALHASTAREGHRLCRNSTLRHVPGPCWTPSKSNRMQTKTPIGGKHSCAQRAACKFRVTVRHSVQACIVSHAAFQWVMMAHSWFTEKSSFVKCLLACD